MLKKASSSLAIIWAGVLFACQSSGAYDVVPLKDTGAIKGEVKYQGQAPERTKIKVTRDKPVCGKEEKFSESLMVGDNGGLQNAVVMLTNVDKGKAFTSSTSLEIDQRGCQFHPHVLVAQAGVPFSLLNNDGVLHNFRTTGSKNPVINKAQPKFKKKLKVQIAQPEIVRANCDVHEWMNAWVVVTDHPYVAVTDETGAFRMDEVPPGTYDVKLWHETLGEQQAKVTVKPGEAAVLDFKVEPN